MNNNTIEIDGEVFEIRQRKKGYFANEDGKFSVGYYLKGQRSGTLIVESTIDKVKKELTKASKKNKIYTKNQHEESNTLKKNKYMW